MTNIYIFYQNYEFWSIFGQNFDFLPKFRFFDRISIFDQNLDFLIEFRFLTKIQIFLIKFFWLLTTMSIFNSAFNIDTFTMITAWIKLQVAIWWWRIDGSFAELAEIGGVRFWAQIATIIYTESGWTVDRGLMATARLAAHLGRKSIFGSAFSLFKDHIWTGYGTVLTPGLLQKMSKKKV